MLLGYGSLALIPLGLLWRLDVKSTGAVEECADRFTDLLRNPYALFVYVGVFLEGVLCWGGMTYLGAFASHRYSLDQFTVGLLIALFGIGMMVGGLLMDRIRRLFTENTLAVAGGILSGASFLLLILRWPSPAFAAEMFFLGLGYVCLHTTLQLRGTDISSTARGKAFSLFAFSLFLGLSTGSAAFGWLVDRGRYDVMFILVGTGLIGTGVATAFAPQHGTSRRRMKTSDGTCIIYQP
jgi:predicted MFS family arabinose efflux permease